MNYDPRKLPRARIGVAIRVHLLKEFISPGLDDGLPGRWPRSGYGIALCGWAGLAILDKDSPPCRDCERLASSWERAANNLPPSGARIEDDGGHLLEVTGRGRPHGSLYAVPLPGHPRHGLGEILVAWDRWRRLKPSPIVGSAPKPRLKPKKRAL